MNVLAVFPHTASTPSTMRFAVVAHQATATSTAVAVQRLEGVESAVLSPAQAVAQLGRGDIALARLDVLNCLLTGRRMLDGLAEVV